MGFEDMDETWEEKATTAQIKLSRMSPLLSEPDVLGLVSELKVLFMMLTSVDYFNWLICYEETMRKLSSLFCSILPCASSAGKGWFSLLNQAAAY